MSELTQNQKLHNLSFADLCAMADDIMRRYDKTEFENAEWRVEYFKVVEKSLHVLEKEINSRTTDLFPELGEVLNEKK